MFPRGCGDTVTRSGIFLKGEGGVSKYFSLLQFSAVATLLLVGQMKVVGPIILTAHAMSLA